MDKRLGSGWHIESQEPNETVAEFKSMLTDLTRLISDWVWETDENFRLTYVSNRIFDCLRLPVEDAIGKKLSQLGILRSASGAPLELDFRKPFRDVSFDAEDRAGTPISMLISGLPVYDRKTESFAGVRGITTDITATKKAREASDQLGFAVENFSESFFLTDSSERLIICNRKFRELNRKVGNYIKTGTLFEEYTRAIVEKGLVPEAAGKEEEWISYRLYLHRNPHGPFEIQREGGDVMRVHEEKLPNGSTATFSMDVTKQKKTEAALRESGQRNRIFTRNAAHQLRTPLGILRANIDNIEDKKIARSLRQDVNSITRIVEQLLDGKRWEDLEVLPDDLADLSDVCRNVVEALAPITIQGTKHLVLDAPKTSVWVNGVAESIEVAVRNLIENAIKHALPKSEIILKLTSNGHITACNQGLRISSEDIERILDPDIRFDRRGGHMGLGLEIVKGIAKAHFATLLIESSEKTGTSFKLQFQVIDLKDV